MPRKAREKALYSTYKISQTCHCAPFFIDTDERYAFLDCLKRTQKQYGFYLLGYRLCDSGYELLLYDNGNDITRIIRTLNIEYALKIKRDAFKLKERFKSMILTDNEALLNAVKELHHNGECNPFNSYSTSCYKDHLVDEDIIMAIFSHNRETYTAFVRNQMSLLSETLSTETFQRQCEGTCIKTLDEGSSRLCDMLAQRGLTLDDLKKDKSLRNELIVYFRQSSTLTLKEIGELVGGISESAISKIISKYPHNH
jgi:putative transposase